jgi:RNA polymerase-binding transcription factor DksA
MSHLTTEQLAQLRQQIEAERSRLRQDIREELTRRDGEQYATLAGQVHDAGEESVADLLSDINAAVLGNSIKALREVEAAQERLRQGTYGRCEECGEAIPVARLQAYPSARLCLADQERYEAAHPQEHPEL